MCGGNRMIHYPTGDVEGLSPRVRGKRRQATFWRRLVGSIPACAGETQQTPRRRITPAVYPRVCGGNFSETGGADPFRGLSPRVRGKLRSCSFRRAIGGSIPACAGETAWPRPLRGWRGVYPRVCGGNPWFQHIADRLRGLSPRVRGKQSTAALEHISPGSIPACAGETR